MTPPRLRKAKGAFYAFETKAMIAFADRGDSTALVFTIESDWFEAFIAGAYS
jgi:hypothetical protein